MRTFKSLISERMRVSLGVQVPEEHGEDDSSEKTPSKASKSPQKTTKRPKTVPVKVSLLDGSVYEAAVEVRLRRPAPIPVGSA